MHREIRAHWAPPNVCACGVPKGDRPEFHKATYYCDCPHHDRRYCPMCVLEAVLVDQTEKYLGELA